MARNFGKIYESIFESSIMEEALHVRYLWHCLIILADQDGIVDSTPHAISRKIRLSVEEVVDGLRVLETPDENSRTPDCDGRRIIRIRNQGYGWRIINKKKYRETHAKFDKAEYQRDYMAEYRKRKAGGELDSHKTNESLQGLTSVSVSESSYGEGGGEEGKNARQEDEKVFQAWIETLPDNGGRPHLFNEKRRSKVRARRRDGYPLQDLLDAVRGWKFDKWEERWKNNDLAILLRDGPQLEKFRDMFRNCGNGKPPQPPRVARSGGKVIEQHELTRDRLRDLVHKLRMNGREKSVYFSEVADSPAERLPDVEAKLRGLLAAQSEGQG